MGLRPLGIGGTRAKRLFGGYSLYQSRGEGIEDGEFEGERGGIGKKYRVEGET